jgi:hypothetical protein
LDDIVGLGSAEIVVTELVGIEWVRQRLSKAGVGEYSAGGRGSAWGAGSVTRAHKHRGAGNRLAYAGGLRWCNHLTVVTDPDRLGGDGYGAEQQYHCRTNTPGHKFTQHHWSPLSHALVRIFYDIYRAPPAASIRRQTELPRIPHRQDLAYPGKVCICRLDADIGSLDTLGAQTGREEIG